MKVRSVMEKSEVGVAKDNAMIVTGLNNNIIIVGASWASNVGNTALKKLKKPHHRKT